jgi:adiponectin receptor
LIVHCAMCWLCGSFLRPAGGSSSKRGHHRDNTKQRVHEPKDRPKRQQQLLFPPLRELNSVPDYLKWNPYITTGYRCDLTLKQCLLSFFSLHNETGNVWTHFLAAIYFVWVSISALTWTLAEAPLLHKFIFSIFLIAAVSCFFGSCIYHLCFPQSIKTVYWLAVLDYTGIAGLMLGCYYPAVYYGLYCFPLWQQFYLTVITLTGCVALVGPWFPQFHNEYSFYLRVGVYTAVGCCGIVPTIHSFYLLPLVQVQLDPSLVSFDPVYHRIYLMYFLYGLGLVFYVSQFPECIFPGKFDIWFNSHQWWHVFVFLGTYTHWTNCLLIYHIWHHLPCH